MSTEAAVPGRRPSWLVKVAHDCVEKFPWAVVSTLVIGCLAAGAWGQQQLYQTDTLAKLSQRMGHLEQGVADLRALSTRVTVLEDDRNYMRQQLSQHIAQDEARDAQRERDEKTRWDQLLTRIGNIEGELAVLTSKHSAALPPAVPPEMPNPPDTQQDPLSRG